MYPRGKGSHTLVKLVASSLWNWKLYHASQKEASSTVTVCTCWPSQSMMPRRYKTDIYNTPFRCSVKSKSIASCWEGIIVVIVRAPSQVGKGSHARTQVNLLRSDMVSYTYNSRQKEANFIPQYRILASRHDVLDSCHLEKGISNRKK